MPSSGVTRYGRLPEYQSVYSVLDSGPTTATFLVVAGRGRVLPEFFSSTMASAAVRRFSAWCSGLLTTSLPIFPYGPPSGSNSPSRNRMLRMCRTAVFTSDSLISPWERALVMAVVVGPALVSSTV